MFHQPARPGSNQPLSVQNLSHLHPLWSYTVASDLAYDMTVVDGVVYMNGLQNVVAIQNGKRLWRYHLPGNTLPLPLPLVSGNAVYLALNTQVAPYTENAIVALNAATGQERWRYRSRTSLTQLAADPTVLYFSTDQQVGALDRQTGTLRWLYRFSDGSPYASSEPALIAASGQLYLALDTSPYRAGTALMAFDGRTGNVKWHIQEAGVSRATNPQASPFLLANGVIYRWLSLNVLGPNSQTVELSAVDAITAITGKEVWRVPLASSGTSGWSMHLFQNLLYLNGQNDIQARDLSNGHLVWSTEQLKGNGISFEPAMSNGVIYVATDERLPPWSSQHPRYWVYAFNAQSGKLVRMLEDGDASFQPGSLQADQEHVYVVGSQLVSGAEYLPVPEPELDVLGV